MLRLTIPGVGEDVEQLELSFTAGGNAKWYFGKYLVVSYKVKYTPLNLLLDVYLGEIKYVHTIFVF